MGQIVDFKKMSEYVKNNCDLLIGPIEVSDPNKFLGVEVAAIAMLNTELFSLFAAVTAFRATYSDEEVPEDLAKPILFLCDCVKNICAEMDSIFKEYTDEIGYKSWRDIGSFSDSLKRIEELFGTE